MAHIVMYIKLVANEKNILLLLKKFYENVRSRCRKFINLSKMQNDTLMHREGLKC